MELDMGRRFDSLHCYHRIDRIGLDGYYCSEPRRKQVLVRSCEPKCIGPPPLLPTAVPAQCGAYLLNGFTEPSITTRSDIARLPPTVRCRTRFLRRCPLAEEGQCQTSPHCYSVKGLWRHIAGCMESSCMVRREEAQGCRHGCQYVVGDLGATSVSKKAVGCVSVAVRLGKYGIMPCTLCSCLWRGIVFLLRSQTDWDATFAENPQENVGGCCISRLFNSSTT